MDIFQTGRLVLVLLGLSLMVGCVRTVTMPDGTEVPKDEYRAQQAEAHNERIAQALMAKVSDCPADMTEKEASECRWSNALMMVVLPQTAQQLSANDGYWQYRAQKRQFWLQIATLALNNPFTQAFAYDQFGGGSSSGSTVKITAKDGSRIDNVDMTTGNRSPFMTGDDAIAAHGSSVATQDGTAANRDGQVQNGDGTQGQAVTRPNNQPNPQTEGGAINNDSEGFGIDGSL